MSALWTSGALVKDTVQYPFRTDRITYGLIKRIAERRGISINEWLLRAAERELARSNGVMSR